jgi:hypothetical protein
VKVSNNNKKIENDVPNLIFFLNIPDEDDDDDSADDLDETALEGFTTPIDDEDNPETVDEYIAFQEVMNSKLAFKKKILFLIVFLPFKFKDLSAQDPSWYAMLLQGLTPEQQKSLSEIFVLAEQKKVHKRSKEIEKSGGKSKNKYLYYFERSGCKLENIESVLILKNSKKKVLLIVTSF